MKMADAIEIVTAWKFDIFSRKPGDKHSVIFSKLAIPVTFME
jgi:hypothetical protein